jgi:hypothetical protein
MSALPAGADIFSLVAIVEAHKGGSALPRLLLVEGSMAMRLWRSQGL